MKISNFPSIFGDERRKWQILMPMVMLRGSALFSGRPFKSVARIAFCLFVGAGSFLFADSVPVTADAHINTAFPAVNFGNSPFLALGPTSRAFIRFDLSTLGTVVPGDVQKVNLVVWVGRVTSPG